MPPKSRFKQQGRPSLSSGLSASQRTRSIAYGQTRENLIVASKVIEGISEATDLLKPLKATCQVLRLVLETTQAIDDNTEEWNALESKLKSHLDSLETQCATLSNESEETKAMEPGFFNPLKAYIENLESLQDAVLSAKSQRTGLKGFFKSITGVRMEAGLIRTYTRDIDDHFRDFSAALQLFVADFIQCMDQKVQRIDKKVDRILPSADASALNNLERSHASKLIHDECLAGTRVPILHKIREWANDEGCEKRIFWLKDIAGSGKSTVASTMANEWRRENRLGGCFFFSISDDKLSATTSLCSAIARDLHAFHPALRSAIQAASTADTAIVIRPFEEQFIKLICEPLRDHFQTVILVVDALDECKDKTQRKVMLQTLVANNSIIPNLKVFVTSRPEPEISAIVSPAAVVCSMEFLLHGVEHKYNVDDITTYIKYHLSNLLTDQQQSELVKKAGGLFIWASTARKILEESPNKADLVMAALLSTNKSSDLADLDSLYQLILQRALPSEKWQDILCSALAVLAVVYEPISLSTLDQLLPVKGRLEEIIGRMGSVLKVDDEDRVIHFRHPTFHEYLHRCDYPSMFIDTRKAHFHIATTALRLLSDLHSDVLGIWEQGTRVPLNDEVENLASLLASRIGAPTLYSAKFWSFHSAMALDNVQVLELVKGFLKGGLLNWLELVAWRRSIHASLSGLIYLRKSLEKYAGHSGDHDLIRGWVNEAIRFAQSNQAIIEKAALHVHLSAILFCPRKTWIYDTYNGLTKGKMPNILSGIPNTWPTHHILAGHSDSVRCLAFSPDGRRIVSGSDDKTLRLWDVDSGAQIGSALKGHLAYVRCLAFSPDGKRVVSGSVDGILRLWDPDSGTQIGNALEGHSRPISCVTFSPDGKRVVSSSFGDELRLWDADSGAQIGNALEGHLRLIYCLAFSPDCKRIVSGSGDNMLRLWDTDSGAQVGGALEGHSDSVRCIGFSPDGKRVVSGSDDSTLRLWDASSGAQIGRALEGHLASVRCLSFSPDGKSVVSGSYDSALRLWDVESGAQIGGALEGHSVFVKCLAFSPDGKRIVSGSADRTLRLWDADSGARFGGALNGHSKAVWILAFSPDGKCIVSGSSDNTLRLWDAGSGAQIGSTLEGHSDLVNCLTFSPDGTLIVSGSDDSTLRVWDANSGAQFGSTLEGHSDSILCCEFLPDGKRIVSGSRDNTLRLWEVDSGSLIATVNARPSFHSFSDGSTVYFGGRKWRVSPTGLMEGFGQSSLPSIPHISSPIQYELLTHTIGIASMPEHLYFLPLDLTILASEAHGGVMVLGASNGRVLIIDSTHLLRSES